MTHASSDLDLEKVIASSREQYLDYNFDKALEILAETSGRDGLAVRCRIDLLRAQARVHLTRGYPLLARDCLTQALSYPHDCLNELSLLSLRVHLAFVVVVGCGENPDHQSCLLAADQAVRENKMLYTSEEMEMASHLARVMIARHTFCEKKGNCYQKTILEFLRPRMQYAASERRYDDLWQLYSPFAWAEDGKICSELIELLLRNDDLPGQLRGHFALEMFALEAGEKTAKWLHEAKEAFRSRDNNTGVIQVQGMLLSHGFEPASNLMYELVMNMNCFVEANFPRLVLTVATHVLGSASRGGRFGLYTQIQEVLHNVAEIAGMQHERLLLNIQHCATMNITSSQFGAFMELSQALYDETRERKFWTQHYLIGQTRVLALLQARKPAEAYKLAQELLTICEREDLQATSNAIYNLAIAQRDQVFENLEAKIQNWNSVCQMLEISAHDDVSENDKHMACQKLCLSCDVRLQIIQTTTSLKYEELVNELFNIINVTRDIAASMDGGQQDAIMILTNCDEVAVRLLLMQGVQQSGSTEKEEEAIKICDKIVERYSQHSMDNYIGMKYLLRGMCFYQCFQKTTMKQDKIDALINAERDLMQSTIAIEQLGLQEPLLIARHSLTGLYVATWELGMIDQSVAFEQILALEDVITRRRRELSILGSLPALQQKQRFNSRKEVTSLYSWVTFICINQLDTERLWTWSQKRKARGLADMLGLGTLMPSLVAESFSGDEEALKSFRELKNLSRALSIAIVNQKSYIRQHISDIEAQLSKYDDFKRYLALRDGSLTNFTQSEELASFDEHASGKSRDVIFVDYIINQKSLFCVTVNTSKPHQQPSLSELPISLQAICDWTQEYFRDDDIRRMHLKEDDLRDPGKPFRKLDGLISHLQSCSKPGDLLIMCPTSSLSAIPLHALKIWHEGKNRHMHLIQRNPVVYTPSFTITSLCISRTVAKSQAEHQRQVFLGVYDKPIEAEKIYQQLRRLAADVGGECFVADQISKTTFGNLVKEADVVLYYGHCQYSAENILQQALILSTADGPTSTTDIEEPPPTLSKMTDMPARDEDPPQMVPTSPTLQVLTLGSMSDGLENNIPKVQEIEESKELMLSLPPMQQSNHLTTEEIFKMRMNTSLMVLMACESAAQTISVGDEPLGLVSGLMFAGVASVIGALWPIPVKSGRAFCDKFWHDLQSRNSSVIDVAVLLQDAVMDLIDEPDTSSPYYWGAFSLHGSWLMGTNANGMDLGRDGTA